MKFRKKPVVIEAFQIPPNDGHTREYPQWVLAAIMGGRMIPLDSGGLAIGTLEGTMRGDIGDWVIQGVKGELYPYKPDIFEATYEAVPETPGEPK